MSEKIERWLIILLLIYLVLRLHDVVVLPLPGRDFTDRIGEAISAAGKMVFDK